MSQKIMPVAGAGASCYFIGMAKDWVRRLPVLLIAVLLAAGFAVHAIHGINVSAETMVGAANCVLTQEKCGSRGNDNALALESCTALNCNSATAIDVVIVAIDTPLVEPSSPIAVPTIKGHKDPPDPYPPRLGILS